MSELSSETKKVMTEGEQLALMVRGDAWAIAKRMLNQKLLELGNILSITAEEKERVVAELGARQMAIETVIKWVNELEGVASQHENNREAYKKIVDDSHIINLEN